ncbi:MAG: fumarylacetoacetate hydrolase family protein [Myxococcales bacterium]|nr:fumarylacetoacetate hydrolase family protein [Myxococcales bacterium]
MRWATFNPPSSDGERVGLVHDGALHALEAGTKLVDLLGDEGEKLNRAGEEARARPHDVYALADVELLAPIPRPPSVRDFMAFNAHYENVQRALKREIPPVYYQQPCFYFTNPAGIVGAGADVAIAPGSAAWDYELEAAAIIGRSGQNVTPQEAEGYIAGYAVLCDFSARDLQAREMPLLGPAKGKDTATSIGPYLVTPDEVASARGEWGLQLEMKASVNGKPYSAGRMDSIDWQWGELLSYAARGTELRPGDVIGSGTVGTGCILELMLMHGADRYPWLKPGDQVELEIERLGTLRHRIVPGVEPIALPPRRARAE